MLLIPPGGPLPRCLRFGHSLDISGHLLGTWQYSLLPGEQACPMSPLVPIPEPSFPPPPSFSVTAVISPAAQMNLLEAVPLPVGSWKLPYTRAHSTQVGCERLSLLLPCWVEGSPSLTCSRKGVQQADRCLSPMQAMTQDAASSHHVHRGPHPACPGAMLAWTEPWTPFCILVR